MLHQQQQPPVPTSTSPLAAAFTPMHSSPRSGLPRCEMPAARPPRRMPAGESWSSRHSAEQRSKTPNSPTDSAEEPKTHGLIVDYLGVFDDVAQAIQFDEEGITRVISKSVALNVVPINS